MLSPNYFTGAVTSDRNWPPSVPLPVKHPSSPIYDNIIIPLKTASSVPDLLSSGSSYGLLTDAATGDCIT